MKKYAKTKYAHVCKQYHMHKYAQNMHKYAKPNMHKYTFSKYMICINMCFICSNMLNIQKYAQG